jgi:spermidine synthase
VTMQDVDHPFIPESSALVCEEKTPYGHFKVMDYGTLRALLFVRASGEEVFETIIDLADPDLLQVAYTRTMLASFLFRPRQHRCLIVGLGGGAMVRFLNRFFPEVAVDALEIDPAIVRIAAELFGVEAGPKTRIFTEDAFAFLSREGERYDVVYLDAFLIPGADTDSQGMPTSLKSKSFLRSLLRRLRPDGLCVVNLNAHPETPSDIAAIKAVFPSTFLFSVPDSGNIVLVASTATKRIAGKELRRNGREIDRRGKFGFSFASLVDGKLR